MTTEAIVWECALEYLADHRVISGGNSVEDPLDALEWFFIACGDAIESLVVVLKSSTVLTEKKKVNEGLPREQHAHTKRSVSDMRNVRVLTCQPGRPHPCISFS